MKTETEKINVKAQNCGTFPKHVCWGGCFVNKNIKFMSVVQMFHLGKKANTLIQRILKYFITTRKV